MNSHDDLSALWRLAKSLEKHAPDTPLAHCDQMHHLASQAGRALQAKDPYGRPLGMAYWDIQPSPVAARHTATLSYFSSVPGRGPLLLAHLLAHLAAAGVQLIKVPARRRQPARQHKVFSITRALRKLPRPAQPIARTELHPVLAGQSAGPDAEAAMAGAALHVLAQMPRLAQATVQGCVQLIDRARGAGHLRVIYGAGQQPIGVLVWGRPSAADLGRLWQPKNVAGLHACELNMGGDMALIEYAALHPGAVAGLLDALRSELDADGGGGGVNLLLQRAGNDPADGDIVSIGRDNVPSFMAWFNQQLTAQAAHLQARQA